MFDFFEQIKDLSLKLSGAYRQCKPFATSSIYLKGTPQRSLESDDETPEITKSYCSGCGSSTSTPTSNPSSSSKAAAMTPMFVSPAGRFNNIVFVEEEEPMEWIVEVETGVVIALISLPKGKNHLKQVSIPRSM